jgi:excinuclease ABC subunit B
MDFKLKSPFKPTGDQSQAIEKLSTGYRKGDKDQVLLGVTGSGKTFTMANVIQNLQVPTLVIAHNKTLAAQLYQELRDFFPNNAVCYFVSYYDYYQPEAYIPSSDTYIEKTADINDEIDKLRLAATTNLLTRKDVIVVASVSCIYNLGSPVEYGSYLLEVIQGEIISRESLLSQLVNLQYERSDSDLKRGSFRLRGDIIQVWPAYQDTAINIDTLENKIISINEIDPVSGTTIKALTRQVMIYPAKHYLVDPDNQKQAIKNIELEMLDQVNKLNNIGKKLEAYRLEKKVKYDLDMIREFGFTSGIENYSRHFDGRKSGEPPFSLLEHFRENVRLFKQKNFLTIIDESHMTAPQIRGMYFGDKSRKQTLIDYGFRLPSAIDNRPLQFHEFLDKTDQKLYVSATPSEWELKQSQNKITEQLVRPTGLLDPEIEIRKSQGQIENLILEILKRKKQKQRVLVTTLTKKMAEALTDYLNDEEKLRKISDQPLPKVAYLHSDIITLERSDILESLRRGEFDVLVGINLLREGLDLPEVSLVAILDADKEGFLRSSTALIQTMGRAARHQEGRVILYADKITKSMQLAIDETTRRRNYQLEFNKKHKITPISIDKPIRERLLEGELDNLKTRKLENLKTNVIALSKNEVVDLSNLDANDLTPEDKKKMIKKLKQRMNQAAKEWDFELAAEIRNKISDLT